MTPFAASPSDLGRAGPGCDRGHREAVRNSGLNHAAHIVRIRSVNTRSPSSWKGERDDKF